MPIPTKRQRRNRNGIFDYLKAEYISPSKALLIPSRREILATAREAGKRLADLAVSQAQKGKVSAALPRDAGESWVRRNYPMLPRGVNARDLKTAFTRGYRVRVLEYTRGSLSRKDNPFSIGETIAIGAGSAVGGAIGSAFVEPLIGKVKGMVNRVGNPPKDTTVKKLFAKFLTAHNRQVYNKYHAANLVKSRQFADTKYEIELELEKLGYGVHYPEGKPELFRIDNSQVENPHTRMSNPYPTFTASNARLGNADISSLATFVRVYSKGVHKIDGRKLTRGAKRFLIDRGYLDENNNILSSYRGVPLYSDMPIEVIWKIVKPAIGSRAGFSIAKSPAWADLNIYQVGTKQHRSKDLEEIEDTLLVLDQHGYITFNAAGSVWEIVPRKRNPMKNPFQPKNRRGNPLDVDTSISISPKVLQMAESFHGREVETITDYEEIDNYESELADLGELRELEIVAKGRKSVIALTFDKDCPRLATRADGKQLYFVGGDQTLTEDVLEDLKRKGADELSVHGGTLEKGDKRILPIGTVHTIAYFADKHHLEGTRKQRKGVEYEHTFGEENGVKPVLAYDVMNEGMILLGGDYRVEDVGIVN